MNRPLFTCPYCDNPDINHDWREGGPESLDMHGEAYCRDNPEDCEPTEAAPPSKKVRR